MTALKEAEEIIMEFGHTLLPAAEKVIEAHRLLVMKEAYALLRKAKSDDKPFLVLPKEQCDNIRIALSPHIYSDSRLVKKGYDHFLLKRTPVFEQGEGVPSLEELEDIGMNKKK